MDMRILINNGNFDGEDCAIIENALDIEGVDYDWDSGDRLMIYEEDYEIVEDVLTQLGYDLDII